MDVLERIVDPGLILLGIIIPLFMNQHKTSYRDAKIGSYDISVCFSYLVSARKIWGLFELRHTYGSTMENRQICKGVLQSSLLKLFKSKTFIFYNDQPEFDFWPS
jgi:hypothetical protein